MDNFSLSLAVILSVAAFLIVKTGIPILISAAFQKRLLDVPSDWRKVHSKHIPTLGGIVIVGALWLTFSLHPLTISFQGFGYLLASSIIIMVVAMKDDLYVVSPEKKLMGECAAAAVMIFGAGIYMKSFGGVFGIEDLSYPFAVLISFFVYIVVINSVNLIDGVDGLAASVVITASLFFAFWFFKVQLFSLALFSLIFAGSMAGFLWHNREPASVFMGDTGALLSGFYLAFLGIEFLNSSATLPGHFEWQASAPVVLVAVLIVPLYDTLRIFLIRITNGQSPFKADSNHIHHQILKCGYTHSQVTLILTGLNLVVIAGTLLLSYYLSLNVLLMFVAAISLLLFPTVSLKRKLIGSVTNVSFGIDKKKRRVRVEEESPVNRYDIILSHDKNTMYGSKESDNNMKNKEVILSEK